ncbi:hypothetical protein EV356DRAFT_70851 [Viridothelium virens]|uniref:Uncharacterized protein n=1 Tax=Viridothelium virens TaxID=1048519 RepID=A0A6A6HG38_VIRVR|nr:hypothetical protein EV356DRAFT_70851 [Viridothelium virens]
MRTRWAAPIWVSFIIVINQERQTAENDLPDIINSTLYSQASLFNDIKNESNLKCESSDSLPLKVETPSLVWNS